jgi:putative cardiolipin synthase
VVGPAPPRAELEPAWAEMAARAARFRDSDYVRALRATAFGGRVRTGQLPLVPAPAKVLYDLPADPNTAAGETTSAIFPALREVVEKARREVILVSPYLVPGAKGVAVLCGLADRGVRVRALTNSLASTDVPLVHSGYALYRPQLLACGVALHELRPRGAGERAKRIGLSSGTSLHSKAIVVDGEALFIGSMNLDPRSRRLNTEVALKIESAALGHELTALFDEATTLEQAFRVGLDEPGHAGATVHWQSIEDDRPVRYSREPLASAWRRFLSDVLGALAPEELL